MGDEGREPGEYRRTNRGESEQDEDSQRSQVTQVDRGPADVGNIPDHVHRALGRQPETNCAIQEEDASDDHGRHASGEGMGVRLQLRTDDRKVSQSAVDEIRLQLPVVMQGVAEDGREQEQERK